MRDKDKTKEQLIAELVELRRQNSKFRYRQSATREGLKIGEMLMEMGWLTKAQLETALREQEEAEHRIPLGKILIGSGIITAEQLYTALVEQLAELRKLEADRRRTEEELRYAQKYAQHIIDSSLDMIIAVDSERRIIEFNKAAERTFGYSAEEVLGKHVEVLYADPQEAAEVNESIRTKKEFTGEITNKRKNGRTFPSLISGSILHNTKGEFIGYMGISRDIAAQKRMEERLRASEKMASLGRLVAGAAHELNNPIGFIYSNVFHLGRYAKDVKTMLSKYHDIHTYLADRVTEIEKLRENINLDYIMTDIDRMLQDMQEGASRTKGILEALKAFSRPDERGIEDTDINEDIERSLSLLTDDYEGRINIHRDYGDLPRVKCYTGQFDQVFTNLIANACQAIESRGDIWITTRLENHKVIVSIRDNGVGIPKEHIDKIFDPFFTTRGVGEGTGLGLSISYGIVERHNGEILVGSQLGSGTTFTVRIPTDFGDQGSNNWEI
jgi:PAS domain S-box-containing protein